MASLLEMSHHNCISIMISFIGFVDVMISISRVITWHHREHQMRHEGNKVIGVITAKDVMTSLIGRRIRTVIAGIITQTRLI